MRALPSIKPDWLALVLFPFKVYVMIGFPFLMLCRWAKEIIQPQFYGYPEEAFSFVSSGYLLSSFVLLSGAFLQFIFGRRSNATQTLLFLALACVFLFAMRPWAWGMARR